MSDQQQQQPSPAKGDDSTNGFSSTGQQPLDSTSIPHVPAPALAATAIAFPDPSLQERVHDLQWNFHFLAADFYILQGQFLNECFNGSSKPAEIKTSEALNLPLFAVAGFPNSQPILDMNDAVDDLQERLQGHGADTGPGELVAAEVEFGRLRNQANAFRRVLRQLRLDLERGGHVYTPSNVRYRTIGNQDGSQPRLEPRPRGSQVPFILSESLHTGASSAPPSTGRTGRPGSTPRAAQGSPTPGARPSGELTRLRTLLADANDTVAQLTAANSELTAAALRLTDERDELRARSGRAPNPGSVASQVQAENHRLRMNAKVLAQQNSQTNAERSALRAQIDILSARVAELEETLLSARTREAFGGRSDSELVAQVGKLEADLDAANAKKKELAVKIASLQCDLEDAEAKAKRK